MIPLLVLVLTILWFMLGASVGSFANVIIARVLSEKPWWEGRSSCDFCSKKIPFYQLIPVFSFLILRGKSGCCNKKLDISHLVVEILFGGLFVWWYWLGFAFFELVGVPWSILQPVFWLLAGSLLLGLLIADWRHLILPDILIFSLSILTLMYRVALVAGGQYQWVDFGWSVLSMGLGVLLFYALWFVTKGRALGFGDVKLLIPLGLLLGATRFWISLWLSVILGAVVGLGLLLAGRAELGKPIPFGPFLIGGAIISLLVGPELLSWYISLL